MQQRTETRRQWIQNIGLGSLITTVTGLAGCSRNQKPQAPAAGVKAMLATSFPLQVICHGMAVFKMPRPGDDQTTIEIHIPKIDRMDGYPHVYKIGQQTALQPMIQGKTYTLVGPTAASGMPPAIWFDNVVLAGDGACLSTIQPYNSGGVVGTQEWCIVKIPMPDSYKGYKIASHPSLANPIFADGDTREGCDVNITRIPLVHVFRYNTAASASITGDSSVSWDLSSGSKLHIYAEPEKMMPSSNSHLQGLNTFFTRTNSSGNSAPLDLDFYNLSDINNITSNDDGPSGPIQAVDLRTLAQLAGLSAAGDPADCMSIVSW
jgi:hypothetical protein